jgi:hypothetical protein
MSSASRPATRAATGRRRSTLLGGGRGRQPAGDHVVDERAGGQAPVAKDGSHVVEPRDDGLRLVHPIGSKIDCPS